MTEAVKRKLAALGLSATVYTPDDLAANEAGYLSEAQIERLRRINTIRIRVLIGSLAIAVVAIIVTSMVISYTETAKLLVIATGVGTIIAGFIFIPSYFELREAISDGRVTSITGTLQRKTIVDTHTYERPTEVENPWQIWVDDLPLQTNIPTWNALQSNARYIVYFTRLEGHVVLAKPLEPLTTNPVLDSLQFAEAGTRESNQEYRIRLMQRFRFTEAELEQNEEGLRAESQTSKLWDRLFDSVLKSIQLLLVLWFGIGAFSICLMSISLDILSNSGTGNSTQELITTGLQLALVALLGVLVWTLWKMMPVVLDMFTPDVVIMDGPVSLSKGNQASRSTCSFTVNGLEFPINQPAYDILKAGDPYTVYFTPHSQTLLAIEWLGASPFKAKKTSTES
jgi:hypothetical protein